MKNTLYIPIIVSSLLYSYEPSVYGAGDIDSSNPYGLTKTEKRVLDNTKKIQRLYNMVKEQKLKIEGLTTVIEGQNKEIVSLKEELKIFSKMVEPLKKDSNKSYSLLLKLGEMIDNINNSYISRDELQNILSGDNRQHRENSSYTNSTPQANSSDLYKEGLNLISQGNYSLAKDNFLQSLADRYKPASSNYYLGECSYYMRDYKDAIAYYKQSASLYDKASYMPVLYLHTAISLNKIGENEQAKGFFQYLIDNYPNSKSASIAKKRI